MSYFFKYIAWFLVALLAGAFAAGFITGSQHMRSKMIKQEEKIKFLRKLLQATFSDYSENLSVMCERWNMLQMKTRIRNLEKETQVLLKLISESDKGLHLLKGLINLIFDEIFEIDAKVPTSNANLKRNFSEAVQVFEDRTRRALETNKMLDNCSTPLISPVIEHVKREALINFERTKNLGNRLTNLQEDVNRINRNNSNISNQTIAVANVRRRIQRIFENYKVLSQWTAEVHRIVSDFGTFLNALTADIRRKKSIDNEIGKKLKLQLRDVENKMLRLKNVRMLQDDFQTFSG